MAAETEPKKIIIDTDPGIDDAMAIFLALQSPEVEVIGLTTIFGNVYTTLATRNALHLLEVAGRTDIPVAEGSHVTSTNGTKLRVADFVHGVDGLGNQNFPPPKGKPIEESAASFLVHQAKVNPGKVTVVALGPLTNIALAIQLDPEFAKNIGQILILGGAFAVNGNVNPAAEANIFGDPEAADVVFTSGADVLAVGINVTHQVVLTESDREKLASSNGKFAQYLNKILDVYFSYHREAYNVKGVYLHDPTVVLAAVDPSLVTCIEGIVRVQTSGITRGITILYNKQKRFAEINEWSNKPTVKVAVTVDAPRVMKLVMDRLVDS
ncbi:Putative uridine nucleosidase 2 [Glycine soja]|uniref:Inosine nucleosidase n=1 Tax=Glycine soja TaxID=3848 RepID=A0A0B2PF35_GLYSO|nr:Putative uridine nucleosidase 2 [Glycine soja]